MSAVPSNHILRNPQSQIMVMYDETNTAPDGTVYIKSHGSDRDWIKNVTSNSSVTILDNGSGEGSGTAGGSAPTNPPAVNGIDPNAVRQAFVSYMNSHNNIYQITSGYMYVAGPCGYNSTAGHQANGCTTLAAWYAEQYCGIYGGAGNGEDVAADYAPALGVTVSSQPCVGVSFYSIPDDNLTTGWGHSLPANGAGHTGLVFWNGTSGTILYGGCGLGANIVMKTVTSIPGDMTFACANGKVHP